LKQDLLLPLDRDTTAFNGLIAALRSIPKNASPTAPEYRSALEAVDSAYKLASAIPLAVAESALDTLNLLNQVAEFGLATALSDLAVATAMADAALSGASWNVRINLKEIKDQSFITDCTRRLTELDQARQNLRAEIERKLLAR